MTAMSETSDPSVSRNSAEWDRARSEAIRRDQYRCQYCGMNEGRWDGCDLQVHHIRPVSNGGTHDLENLTTLCNKCHWKLHNRFDDRDRLSPNLLNEVEDVKYRPKVERVAVEDLRSPAPQIVKLLRENGPMQLKNIIEATGYSRSHIQTTLDSLKFGNHVCRVERGVYAYITVIQYRKMLAEGRDEHGDYRVHVWDPGKQTELGNFVEVSRGEGNDAE